MQKLTMNKNVYDTMLGHFGDKLDKLAEEFNEYLTPQNVIDDYQMASNTLKFSGSKGKMITFVTHLDPSVKSKLNTSKVKQLDFDFELWFDKNPDVQIDIHELLGKYFQLFIIRKLDYFGTHIIDSKAEEYDKNAGIHSDFLSLCEDSTERRIAALMGVLLANCSVSDQRRIMTIIELKFEAEKTNGEDKFNDFFEIIDCFLCAQKYPDL